MCALWPFSRRKSQEEDPGPLLPGEKSIGESERDVTDFLSAAVRPDGRIAGVFHPETSRRDDKLGPGGPEPGRRPKPAGLAADPAFRGRAMALLYDALGKQAPKPDEDRGEDAFHRDVDDIIREARGRMSREEFEATLEASLTARQASADAKAVRSLRMAAGWLRMKSKDVG